MSSEPRNQIIDAMAWLLKLALKVTLAIVLVGALSGSAWYGYQYFFVELPKSKVEMTVAYRPGTEPYQALTDEEVGIPRYTDLLLEGLSEEEKLRLELRRRQDAARSAFFPTDVSNPSDGHSGASCPAEFPLLTSFLNGSRKRVEKIWFYFTASQPRHSTGLTNWPTARRSSDRILDPGERVEYCWAVPELNANVDPATLDWTVELEDVRFAD